MNKKRWILLIITLLLITGWYKLFYKTWNTKGVAENADCIIALDVKRITNTLIWNFITTPSQWKRSNWFSSGEEGKVSWDDMVSLPDYVFIFHRSGEPENAFYTVAEINDMDDFITGLKQYGFEKTATGSYISATSGIELIQYGNKLLIGNASIENKSLIKNTAAAIFQQQQVIDHPTLKKTIDANSHFALHGVLFNQSSIAGFYQITGNFDDKKIRFSMPVHSETASQVVPQKFSYCDTALFSFGCSQPAKGIENISLKQRISKLVNFPVDSLLLPTNRYYQLEITGIYPRTDSAISYTYDDNFNAIENVTVNKVEEPSFIFTVAGDKVNNIYDYWRRNGKFDNTGDSSWFTPVPFVKSYCSIKNNNTLAINSAGYREPGKNASIETGMFVRIVLSKVPASLLNYFPQTALKILKNIETVEAVLANEKGQTFFYVQLNKKKNDLPLVEL